MSIQYFLTFLFILSFARGQDLQEEYYDNTTQGYDSQFEQTTEEREGMEQTTEEDTVQQLIYRIQVLEHKVKALESTIQKSGCQEYLVHGYHYDHRFMLGGVGLGNTLVQMDGNDLVYFEMHLAIKAPKDAMIMLAPNITSEVNHVFEIAIGILQNQYTVLRFAKDSPPEAVRVATPDILTREKYTQFYVKISKDVLTFGRDGVDEEPIITHKDKKLRTVKYFDMSAWGTIGGKFLFDCPTPKSVY